MRVRVVVSQKSNNVAAMAALRHRYEELAGAGVEVWEVPGTVVHAKVVVADDVVSFGTVNLDALALYRDSEVMMIARSHARGSLRGAPARARPRAFAARRAAVRDP